MKLIDKLSEVSRPYNPEYAKVWDCMSSRERKISRLIDILIISSVLFGLFVLSAIF